MGKNDTKSSEVAVPSDTEAMSAANTEDLSLAKTEDLSAIINDGLFNALKGW